MSRIAIVFLTLALAVASAKTYTVSLLFPSILAGTELKAGDYDVAVEGSKVVFKRGAKQVEAQVTVRTEETNHRATGVRLVEDSGKHHIREIRFKGTRTTLVIN